MGGHIRTLIAIAGLLWIGSAHARGTASGLGMPQYGGAFAGVGESGVHGLPYNPAAASVSGLEVGLEWTEFFATYTGQLEGETIDPARAARGAPFAALALGIPSVDWMGLGATFGAPFIRAAGNLEDDSPQRFHGLSGQLQVLGVDGVVAIEPAPGVQLGGGAAFHVLYAESRYALDTGAVLVELFGEDMEPLIGEPWLEGEVDLTEITGRGMGAVVGLNVSSIPEWTVAGSYRTLTRIPVSGTLDLVPSNSFTLTLESGLEGEILMPPSFDAMVGRELGNARVAVEGQWVGWSQVSVMAFELIEPELGSRDPVMEAILEGYGLSDVSQLGQTQADRISGYEDSVGAGIRVDYDADRTYWMMRSFYGHRAVPDAWAHPGNMDFSSLDTRVGAGIRTDMGLDVGLSAGWYHTPKRVITTSKASFLTDPEDGPVLPSGNGTYDLQLFSVGLNLVYRLQ